MSMRKSYGSLLHLFLVFSLAGFLTGCGGGGGAKPPVPAIQNLNSSTSPSSAVNLPIEINGTGFQKSPGQVIFTQGSVTATVTPSAGGWSDTGIVAVVPAGNGTTQFTLPGTVSVSVKTSGGTSNALDLKLVQPVTFSVNNVSWTTTTPLPTPLAGLGAVAVPSSSASSAFVVVTGGYDGTQNQPTVLANTIKADGTLGVNWSAIAAAPLTAPRAHHAMAEADPGNSLVPVGSRFIYVIGGQEISTHTPGGTSTVLMAPVDSTTGTVGPWTQLANSLPLTLIGPGVALFNGHIYVVGGLQQSGIPSSDVYSAPVNADGTIGAWTKSNNPYPVPVSFPTVFGFAGNLYVVNGDTQNQTSPNVADNGGITDVRFASAHFGVVGAWTSTASTVKNRSKQVVWRAFGQILDAEGVYSGSPGCCELERTIINPDSTLASWNSITNSVNEPGANVYNAAAIVSPVLSPSNAPRFLLFGGQQYIQYGATNPTNPITSTVYVNSAP